MDILHNIQNAVHKAEEKVEEVMHPEHEVVAPAGEPEEQKEEVTWSNEPEVKEVVDATKCVICKGEGLVEDGWKKLVRCGACGGTGKVI